MIIMHFSDDFSCCISCDQVEKTVLTLCVLYCILYGDVG